MLAENSITCNLTYNSKFDAFRLTGKYTDVTIKCEDKLFKCHRIILAAASDNFNTVFLNTSDQNKRQKGARPNKRARAEVLDETFDLTDFVNSTFVISADVFEKIIQFVYTGRVEIITADHWREFLLASISLELCCVKELCVACLKTNRMSVQNILEVLKLLFETQKDDAESSEFCCEVAEQLRIFCTNDTFPQIPFEVFSSILKKASGRPSTVYNSDDVMLNCIIRWVLHDRVQRLPHLGELFKHLRGPGNSFENVSPATMESAFSELLKLVSPAISGPTLNDEISSRAVSYHIREDSRLEERPSVDQKTFLYIYTRTRGEAWMRVCSLHRHAGQDKYNIVGRIQGWKITESHNPWIRSVAVNNRLYNLYYGRRSSAQDKETQNQSFDCCTTKLDSAVGLRPPPVIFDDVKLCATRNNFIYAYNQTLSRRRHRIAESASAREWSPFSDEEIAAGIYMYHCELDRWFPVPAMEERVADACMAIYEDRLYLIGGMDPTGTVQRCVQAYDFRTRNWQYVSSSGSRWFLGADGCALNDRIYVTGGVCDNQGSMVAVYDIKADNWATFAPLNTRLQYHRLLPYRDGILLAMGCFDEKNPSCTDLCTTAINTNNDSNPRICLPQKLFNNKECFVLDAVSFE